MKTIPYIEIDAPSLGVMEGEDNFIYGKALGLHIKNKLAIHNYSVPDPVPEEYRWCVFAERDGFRMEISVFGHLKDDFYESEVEDQDGDLRIPAGTPLELWIRVRTHPRSYWSWSQFRSVDRSQQVFELHESILRVLESDPQITVLRCCDELPIEEDLVSD